MKFSLRESEHFGINNYFCLFRAFGSVGGLSQSVRNAFLVQYNLLDSYIYAQPQTTNAGAFSSISIMEAHMKKYATIIGILRMKEAGFSYEDIQHNFYRLTCIMLNSPILPIY